MPTTSWLEVRRRAALTGRVTDAESKRPVAGARVELVTGPAAFEAVRRERPGIATATSARDGHFHFLDLPGGRYAATAAVPGGRYGVARDRASVRRTRDGDLVAGKLELEVPPTRIEGRVLAEDGTPVRLAEVRVAGTPQRAVTDAEGRFVLRAVELGRQQLTVSARGFVVGRVEVRVTRAGQAKTTSVKLAPAPS